MRDAHRKCCDLLFRLRRARSAIRALKRLLAQPGPDPFFDDLDVLARVLQCEQATAILEARVLSELPARCARRWSSPSRKERTMLTHSIERSSWTYFFDSLSRIYDGASATLEVVTADRGARCAIEQQPLRGIRFDTSEILLQVLGRDGARLTHRIANPRRVLLLDNYGIAAAIEIESDSEPMVILHLNAVPPSRLLA